MIPLLSLPGMRRFERFFNLDVALRYLPIADRLPGGVAGRLLEVGSGNRGLAAYLPERVIGVEPRPTRAATPRLRPVVATGTALPFASGSFDTVVSVDVLEHLPAAERPRFIEELVRVASRRVVLAFPAGALAAAQDRSLADRYRRLHGKLDQSLAEHLEYGLPDAEPVRRAIERSARRPVAVRVAKSLNLSVRRWIMSRWMSPTVLDLALYRLGALLIPFRRWLNFGPCYRVILDVSLGESPSCAGC